MEIAALALLVGASALANGDVGTSGPNAYDSKEQSSLDAASQRVARDIRDAGDVYHVQGKPMTATSAQINYQSEWYIPSGNPTQIPTHNLNRIIESRAVNTAYLEAQAPKYTFASNDVLGISYGNGVQNSGYNIGATYPGISFKWDPGNSLARQGKVFIDRYEIPDIGPYTDSYKTAGGEPTETSRKDLGNEVNVPLGSRNPYGPFGYYQSIYRNQNYAETKLNVKKGIQPHVLQNTKYKKPWQVKFAPQPSKVYE